MDFSTHASLLSAVLCAALAAAVAVRHRVHPTHRAFFLFCLALAAWNAGYFIYLITLRPTPLRALLLFSFCIPPAAVHFLRRFFYVEMPALSEMRRTAIWVSLGLAAATLTFPNQPLPLVGWDVLQVLIVVSTLYLIVTFLYGTYILHNRQIEEDRPVDKARLRYLRNGSAVVLLALGIDTISAPFGRGFHEPRLAAIALTAYAYFVYLSILNYRLLEMQEILGRAILLGAVGGLMALYYVVLAQLAGDSLGVIYLYALISSLVVLLLYRPVRGYLERKLQSLFFEKQSQIRELPQVIGPQMLKTRRPEELMALMLREFARLERVTDVSAYLWNPRIGKYAYAGGKGPSVGSLPNAVQAYPLITVLERSGEPLLKADLEEQLEGDLSPTLRKELFDLLDAMTSLRAELVVPLIATHKCIGLFALQDERAIETYAASEVRAFSSAAGTASILLENFNATEELGERERLASLGEMAAGLAHEIRNPLGSIKGAVQYLEDELETSAKGKEFFDVIVEETDRLSKVVEEFLDYSRKPVLRKKPVDLGQLADRVLRQLGLEESDPNVEITTDFPAGIPPAMADPDRIKQVLINLVQNAISVMPEGGKVRVFTGHEKRPEGEMVWIAVRDTGPGMDERTMDRIFQPFFTTREGGSGLGLAISHRIVESHGGSIEVRSAPGEGSEFRVRLPIAAAPAATLGQEAPAPLAESPKTLH